MSHRLQDRIAVVTGSNSGIGRAIALAYGREGATVICANRQAESKDNTEKDVTTHDLIKKNGGKAIFKPLQFTQSASIDALVQEVVHEFGRIDVWVNNAGTGAVGMIWELSDEDFNAAIDINLKGTFRCMRAAAKQMIKQDPLSCGNRGSIINIGSVFGARGSPASTSYSASKAGISGMMRAAVMELSAYKVTVNAICPGFVTTNMTSGLPEDVQQMLKSKAPLGFGEPKDVAGAAILLASDGGRWIQGAEFYVDGGYIV